ncbi:hypothetical protein PROFUN_05927 [Planoprotostelium fungivorum]|uniref:Uncharacterized protein n=1 Tax=Planoprotostelium fungivorum TaxID=1890364 RepID=A0A2P6N7M2_9EUKA|nr:hypothetical protein PROFUN_05927 [Planoprotostelium fungivorum]
MRITAENVAKFEPVKLFNDNEKRINSLDFNVEGGLLITSSDDESLNLYDTNQGKKTKTIHSRKYGADLVRFTREPQQVIVASSNEWDQSMRLLSLDNRYLRYYKGHRDKVVSISLSPKDNTFISASLDSTIRFWDLLAPTCQGLLRRKGRASVSFDPQGVVFAMASNNTIIKLYDIRNYDRGSFSTFSIPQPTLSDCLRVVFSSDGSMLLLTMSNQTVHLIDSFSGQLKHSYKSTHGLSGTASFSPDGQFVICGGTDGNIHCWSSINGNEICQWRHGSNVVEAVSWNPRSMMLASVDNNHSLCFWLPQMPQ